mmetsp:Transcript_19623/g.32975  ORF Transcript_19623/g.32975 Transcript_19623/m.32975 type:complete len:296 (-) Transcript_19623:2198-3085(-)
MTVTLERSSCNCTARALTSLMLPSSVTAHSPRSTSSAAAVTTRLSLPSGSTMCFCSARAFLKMRYWKIFGVITCSLASLVMSELRKASPTSSSNMFSTYSILRLEEGITVGTSFDSFMITGSVASRTMSTGRATLGTLSSSFLMPMGISAAPVRMMPAIFTSVDWTAKSMPSSTSTRRASMSTMEGVDLADTSLSTCSTVPAAMTKFCASMRSRLLWPKSTLLLSAVWISLTRNERSISSNFVTPASVMPDEASAPLNVVLNASWSAGGTRLTMTPWRSFLPGIESSVCLLSRMV